MLYSEFFGKVAVENIYYANVENDESPLTVARALSKNPLIEYAEPLYIHYLFDTPNGPDNCA